MLIKIKRLASLPAGQAPDSNTLYTDEAGALVTAPNSDAAAQTGATWEDAGHVLDAQGQLTSETQQMGSQTRTRTWTYTTDGSGNVTATPGAWA